MADIKVINRVPEDTKEISCTSSGSDAPYMPRERSRLLVTFVVVMGMMFVWGIALLPAIFYANKLPAPPEPHINKRYKPIIIFCFVFFKSKYFYFCCISIFHLQGLGETVVRFFVKVFDLIALDVTERRKGRWGMGNGKRETGNDNGSLETSSQQNTAAKRTVHKQKIQYPLMITFVFPIAYISQLRKYKKIKNI